MQLEEALERHPDAQITLTLPGMGVVLTSEFHAEVGNLRRDPTGNSLAAASANCTNDPTVRQQPMAAPTDGRQPASQTRLLPIGDLRVEPRPDQQDLLRPERSEGKTHRQAVIALARRRVNVLHAMLRSRTSYQVGHDAAAA
ncbi:hypothetical protein [Tenggerimyces flavus]|uniref:hypothetical protein n=1 Tax=Tenggerimyces flavus TaxID=1708749 RepID=UPI001EF9B52B|nr:hypothetical protein [Tenggerimyces flavus]MBM7790369.1 hypothetical protein [Tenggerimyces flavus]